MFSICTWRTELIFCQIDVVTFSDKKALRVKHKTCSEQEFPATCGHFNTTLLFFFHFRTDIAFPSWFPQSIFIFFIYLKKSTRIGNTKLPLCKKVLMSVIYIQTAPTVLYICIRMAVSSFYWSVKNLHTNWLQENLNPGFLYVPWAWWVKGIRYLEVKYYTAHACYCEPLIGFPLNLLRGVQSVGIF